MNLCETAMFKGLITALVTPFNMDLSLDLKAYADFIEWQIEHGVDGVVALGSTGESPTLTTDERTELVKLAIEVCNGRIPVIVGTGTNNTMSTLSFTQHAAELGADGALVVAPYYNKPPQEGIYQHFKYIADNSNIPIIAYNVPGRTNIDISVETVAKLSRIKGIVGIKDCAGTERTAQIRELIGGVEFSFMTGDDPVAVEYNEKGGNGCISAIANVLPTKCVELQKLTTEGNFAKAYDLDKQLQPLYEALFSATNPIAIKYALSKTGMIKNNLRLPLVRLDSANRVKVDQAMNELGLFYDLAS